jgi:hypothetical protein
MSGAIPPPPTLLHDVVVSYAVNSRCWVWRWLDVFALTLSCLVSKTTCNVPLGAQYMKSCRGRKKGNEHMAPFRRVRFVLEGWINGRGGGNS